MGHHCEWLRVSSLSAPKVVDYAKIDVKFNIIYDDNNIHKLLMPKQTYSYTVSILLCMQLSMGAMKHDSDRLHFQFFLFFSLPIAYPSRLHWF